MVPVLSGGGLWWVQLGVLVVVAVATELAFRVGHRHSTDVAEPDRAQVTTVQAATLGLLALLLGFTLSMAEARFAERKQLILHEANAIGTTFLRTQLLPAPLAVESRDLLRRYVAARRGFYEAGQDRERIHASEVLTTELQTQLWDRAMAMARLHPDQMITGLYVTTLNEVIDLDASRMAALETHVPLTILLLLIAVATIAAGTTGYACGLSGHRSTLSLFVIPVLLALACAIVLDLDQPRAGLIRVGENTLERLEQGLGAEGS